MTRLLVNGFKCCALVLLIWVSSVCFTHDVFAEDYQFNLDNIQDNIDLYIGPGETHILYFTAPQNGEYLIQSYGYLELVGGVFYVDDSGMQISDIDGGQITMIAELVGGNSYALHVNCNDQRDEGWYGIYFTYLPDDEEDEEDDDNDDNDNEQTKGGNIIREDWTMNRTKSSRMRKGEKHLYYLTPSETGEYNIFSSGELDLVALLECNNDTGTDVDEDDDSGQSRNFLLNKVNLIGGMDYLLTVIGYNNNESGSYKLHAELIDSGSGKKDSLELKLDQRKDMYISQGEVMEFTFTPTRSRTYSIKSYGDLDLKATLYYNDRELAENDDYSDNHYNFKIRHSLERGKTYTIRVRCYDSDDSGDFEIKVYD
ncbi:hypothetical protein [Oceanirhabdus sp. W0125-5]|uniref:hypothetical protein n=1 Tax=Oceanirhabdus sp. W0125-5 TaxID=2999116 RepID=UPI0022F2DDA0|nr:hypothetical protein [Oceanirhabdus sp. W0125-5]WBW98097.1 hypothetical protein OW730_04845 [Oceanirhabdus sp. W0125-5]